MEGTRERHLVAEARVGVLGTVTPEGHAHAVPCCFALEGGVIYSAVDGKPKSTLALRRLDNVRANPNITLLVHQYDEDWSTLWWVRVDGSGRIVTSGHERQAALRLLSGKYPQYRTSPPPGEVMALDIERWRSWP